MAIRNLLLIILLPVVVQTALDTENRFVTLRVINGQASMAIRILLLV